MSGIVGCIGNKDIPGVLLQGLARMEFLGYDSVGASVLDRNGIVTEKLVGSVRLLASRIERLGMKGKAGIAGLRYATMGDVSKINAHPQVGCRGDVAVVHTGMIEDHERVKRRLSAEGHKFKSQTDTEVIAHLLEAGSENGFMEAFIEVLNQLSGSFSFLALDAKAGDAIIGACRECSLYVGVGRDFHIVSSEYTPIIAHTREILRIESGQVVRVFAGKAEIFSHTGDPVSATAKPLTWTLAEAQRQGFPSFTLKEINEQPYAVRRAFSNRIGPSGVRFANFGIPREEIESVKHIKLIGSGSSYHAALAGKTMIEEVARIPASATAASGMMGFDTVVGENTILAAVSRSGFTRDTVRAVKTWKRMGGRSIAVCNAMKSPLWDISDARLDIMAGPEIGIATTKGFTNQIAALILLSVFLGRSLRTLNRVPEREILWGIKRIPDQIAGFLQKQREVEEAAKFLKKAKSMFFAGIGFNYPTALEGALKMKQFGAVHAEGISVGELKHQALMLLGKDRPLVALAIQGRGYEPMIEGMREVKRHGSRIVAIGTEGDSNLPELADVCVFVPRCAEVLSPLLTALPVQLLAAYVGMAKGLSIDEPRNLERFFPEKENQSEDGS